MLARSDDARNAIIADYHIGKSPSRRVRRPREREILAAHEEEVRIIELVGSLSLSAVDYVSRRLAGRPRPQFVVFDLHRVTSSTRAGARLIAETFEELAALNVTVVLSGVKRASKEWNALREWTAHLKNVRDFYLLDTAIEWAEDQIVYRYGGSIDFHETTELSEQPLLAGLGADELAELAALCTIRTYKSGEKIVTAGDPADSLFFLRSGAVHVMLPDGVRLATLTAGMAFGEMALIEAMRSADVVADMAATAFEVPLGDFERFRAQHPRAGERMMRNLAQLLADRLIVANAKVDILTSM
jgi:glutaminase